MPTRDRKAEKQRRIARENIKLAQEHAFAAAIALRRLKDAKAAHIMLQTALSFLQSAHPELKQ